MVKKAKIMNMALVKTLQQHGVKKLTEPTCAMNEDKTYKWVASNVQLPTGEMFTIRVIPLGHSKPEDV